MAVESRFVVIRHGVEVQTFMDKKAADDYDKMLDMADNLTAMLESTPFNLSDEVKEDLSIYLAQNRDDVLVALQAKKAKSSTKKLTPKIDETKTLETSNVEPAVSEPTILEPDINTVSQPDESNNNLLKIAPIKEKAASKKRAKTKTAGDIANSPADK